MKNLKEIHLFSKYEETTIENSLGNKGCEVIFNNAKYLKSLKKMDLESNYNNINNR